ncbi:MAG TPA: PKD domain-containing protein, partial [Anaerolineae bacterium]|nr:PKD domain-containing protein [Anaerolineae bacterium]
RRAGAPGPDFPGVAVGFNVLEQGGWQELHHQALGQYGEIGQVRTYLYGMTDLSTFNYLIDATGEASLWENQTGRGQHWEYNTRAAARDRQWIDVDNADADNDPWTGGDVTFSGWVVRANAPAHYNLDGSDDPTSGDGRYVAARDVIAALIYNNGGGTVLSARSIAEAFFRHNVLALDTTVSNMIIQGVLPTEDPRLSTMWTLLGHSKTGIFLTYLFDYGDGQTGSSATHEYAESGHYLVSCRVTDENGVSQTDWLFVMVGQPACIDGLQNQGQDLIGCGGPGALCACLVPGECDDGMFGNGAEMLCLWRVSDWPRPM